MNLNQIKSGDKVEKLDGRSFSNNRMTLTVNYVEISCSKVWFKETSTWMSSRELKLVTPIDNRILEVLEKQRDELQAEVKQLLSKASRKEEELKEIRITIKTVKNYI